MIDASGHVLQLPDRIFKQCHVMGILGGEGGGQSQDISLSPSLQVHILETEKIRPYCIKINVHNNIILL